MGGSGKPCCCVSLRTGAILVAVATIVGSAICMAIGFVRITGVSSGFGTTSDTDIASSIFIRICISTGHTAIYFYLFFASIVLLVGILKQNAERTTLLKTAYLSQVTCSWLAAVILLILCSLITFGLIIFYLPTEITRLIEATLNLGLGIWFFSVIWYYKQEYASLSEEDMEDLRRVQLALATVNLERNIHA